MKKSLLALAAMGAFAGAAQAQSSVTVYGIMDVGFQGVTTRAGTTKTNVTRFSGEGSETTSRLGFRGTEDLGGGMSAFFTAEFGLSPTDWNLSGNANGGLFNRQTFVGLSQKGIGQFAIGTQYTPVHLAVGRTDPGQQNNMLGNVIYATNASQGNGQTTTSYTVRLNNALTFATDRFAGFVVSGIYNNSNSDTNSASALGNTNNEAYGLGLNFVWQKLNVDATYQSLKQLTNSSLSTRTTTIDPAASRSTIATQPSAFIGSNTNDVQMYFGAVYDFGILKAYAQYVSRKVESDINSNAYVQRTAQQIGVRGNLTKTIEAWASGGTGRFSTSGGTTPVIAVNPSTVNFTGYQLGSNYWLSKRTNLYAIFGSTQASSTAGIPSEGGSSYGLGLRHTF